MKATEVITAKEGQRRFQNERIATARGDDAGLMLSPCVIDKRAYAYALEKDRRTPGSLKLMFNPPVTRMQ